MNERAKKLGRVLQSVRELELARLAVATKCQHAAEYEIDAFRAALPEIQDRAFNPDRLMVSDILNVSAQWRQWAEAWTRSKRTKLAGIAADREQQKSRAQLAFARAAAFDALAAKKK